MRILPRGILSLPWGRDLPPRAKEVGLATHLLESGAIILNVAPKESAAGAGTESDILLTSIPIPCNSGRIDMATVTVSPKYQIVFPKDVRDRLVMAPGDKVEVIQLEGRIELMPVRSARSLKGFLRGRKNTFQRENDRCLP